jgi:DNA repair exonuclease SbcCD nuclease subunit
MIRLVWRTDVHLSDRSPAMRTDNWTQTVLGKLDQVRKVAEAVGAVGVLDGGDFFHIKSPSRNSHRLIRQVAELHASYPCPVYATVGNHDCVYGDIEYLDQQPLGVLFAAGVFERLYDEHEVVFDTDNPLYPESDDKVVVRVVGVPYHGTSYDMDRLRSITKGEEDWLVCVAHLLASPKGGTMFEGEDIVKYADLMDLAPDVFCFGHWHKDQGVVRVGDKTIINLGSLSRGTLSQDDIDRKPACAVLTFTPDEAKVNVVRLKVGDKDEVFDLDAKFRSEARDSTMDHFIESMRDSLVLESGKTVQEAVETFDVPNKVRERALLYLEQSDG